MTEKLNFDIDCISSFLWVKEERLLISMYAGSIIVPQQVYNELSYPGTPQLKLRVDYLINNRYAMLEHILINTPEFNLYTKLTASPDKGSIIIGKGKLLP